MAVLLMIVAGFWLTRVLLPTIVPFFGVSLPVWLAGDRPPIANLAGDHDVWYRNRS